MAFTQEEEDALKALLLRNAVRDAEVAKATSDAAAIEAKRAELQDAVDAVEQPIKDASATRDVLLKAVYESDDWKLAQELVNTRWQILFKVRSGGDPGDAEAADYEQAITDRDVLIGKIHDNFDVERQKYQEAADAAAAQAKDDLKAFISARFKGP